MTATSPVPESLSTPADQPGISQATRAGIAHRVEARKSEVIERWYTNQFDPARVERYAIAGIESRESLVQSYLAPLAELLIEVIRTGEDCYRAVYLDERLRYAPHQADPPVLAEFYRELLPLDEAAVLEACEGDHERAALATLLSQLHEPLRTSRSARALRLLAVGDCLLNELRVFLPESLRREGIELDMRCLYFSAVVGRALGTDQVLQFIDRTSPHLIAFSFLTYEGLPPYAALLREADRLSPGELDRRVTSITGTIREFLTALRERTDATFLLHNASGLPLTPFRRRLPLPPLSRGRQRAVAALNRALAELAGHTPNTLLVDEHTVARRHGYRSCSEPVIPPRIAKGAAFHTSRFGAFLVEPYADIVRSYHDLQAAKVLLLDFDNTLWDGVMADGPVRHHGDRQELLRTLKEAGMLLVATSKNTPEQIRWGEMRLAQDDFVLHKISWDLKAKSIAEAAQELDLGLDSFVLIDDNPAERELVRLELPKVRLLDAGDAYTWRSLERLLAFPNTRTTEEARTRTEMYRAQARRREAQQQSFDYPALMTSLQLSATFGRATARDLDRVTELVQRTNQFNTTTIRYSRTELQQFLERSDRVVYVAELSDKFGKLGLVGVAIIARNRRVATFESFVMSCPAMGFGLERLMLRAVMDAEASTERFVGRFLPTDRNTPAQGLFAENGFVQVDSSVWELGPGMPRPELPEWITFHPRA